MKRVAGASPERARFPARQWREGSGGKAVAARKSPVHAAAVGWLLMSYLAQMTFRLSAGATRFSESFCQRHAAYLIALQNPDGGFSGREGSSDLYYTGFALRALALVGRLDEVAGRAAEFLSRHCGRPLPAIDFVSVILSAVLLESMAGIDVYARAGCDRNKTLGEHLQRFRRPDGGYAKTERSGGSSTYHTFLAAACMDLCGATIPEPDRIAALIRARQRPDGGFVELDALLHSGTNPTAAGVGLLRLLDVLDETTRSRSARFLLAMQNREGGLLANTRIPTADLLSTFAGLTALADLEALPAIDAAAARRYVASLEAAEGGFRGAAWDDRPDPEYTFYGLGCLALLETDSSPLAN
jgi:geranylgeranyl transferase type-2 subunit beta